MVEAKINQEGEAMHPCPVCGNALLPILVDGNRAVRCSVKFCSFNFQDKRCEKCGGPVVLAFGKAINVYEVRCAQGHEWTFCD